MSDGRRNSPTAPASLRARLLVEPARPDAVRTKPWAYWLVVATVSIGAAMGQLDASIVSLGLPTLQRAFHVSLADVEWVSLTYLLVLAAAVTAVGRLADMVGRKLLYTYGFAVFTIASVGCGLAPDLTVLEVARAVQGLGAAMLQANSVALIAAAMPAGRLGRGIGVQGAAQAVGLAAGPSVGGALIALGGWRLMFLVNVPLGLLGLALGRYLLPRSRDLGPRTPFDRLGLALLAPAVALVLMALSLGAANAFAAALPWLLLVAGAGFACGFVAHERRAGDPLLDPALFRVRAFRTGITGALLSYLVLFGVLFAVPFLLERSAGRSPASAGLELTVLPVALAVVAPFAGRLSDRRGSRLPTVLGMAVTAASLAGLSLAGGRGGSLLPALAGVGLGLGLFTPANNATVMSSAPAYRSGLAGGVLNLVRSVGTALGVAVATLVFAVVAGPQATGAAPIRAGFSAAVAVLAGLAALTTVVSAARPREARATRSTGSA